MSEFYSIRLNKHLKKMMKYMRYVFNDHFVLVCIFLLGGLGFYYSQLLKTLPEQFIWGRPLVLFVWLVTLFIGRLATLAEEADMVFILPKETEMTAYLNKALTYSLWLPFVACLLIGGMTMPLVVISSGLDFSSFFYFLIMLIGLKVSHLLVQKYALYQISMSQYKQVFGLWLVSSLLIMGISLYSYPILGSVLAIIQVIWFKVILERTEQAVSLDWEGMIRKEKSRMYRLYQFIHLFTDVPEIASSVKRRKFADPLLNRIKRTNENTYLYLYARSFLRGSEYSGLFLRLVLVSGVILFFLKEFWVSMGVSLLFIYLIGFQLIPIYAQFDYMVMTQLYPVSHQQRKRAVSQLLSVLLIIAAGLFSLFVVIALSKKIDALFVVIALLVEVLLFTKFYIPYRLKKMEG